MRHRGAEAQFPDCDNTDRECALRQLGIQVVAAISVMLLYGPPLPQ